MFLLFLEAFWCLVKIDIVFVGRKFAVFYRRVKTYPVRKGIAPLADTTRIVAAFELACIWYPKKVRCLQRSAALTCLLRNHAVRAQMVIGTQKLPFKAHAWVEVEGRVVNDKEYTSQMYAVLDRC